MIRKAFDLAALSSPSSIPFVQGIAKIFASNAENGVESFDKDTQSFLSSSLPKLNLNVNQQLKFEDSQSQTLDPYTSSFRSSETLPSLYNVHDDFFNSEVGDGWSTATLQTVIPTSYSNLDADNFNRDYEGEGGSPIAEQQEDVAPTDPMTISDLTQGIKNDQTEEDKNLSGGITDADHIGVEDGNVEGAGDIDLSDLNPAENPPVSSPETETETKGAEEGETSNIKVGDIAGSLEKEDIMGDIGIDTAVQSSLRAISESETTMKPFIPTPNLNMKQKTSLSPTGVSSNISTDARGILQDASMKLASFNSFISNENESAMKVYNQLKNIESELFSIDNIVYAKDLILTPAEKQHKASNRISRLQGVKNLILDLLQTDPSSPLLPVSLSLQYACDGMILSMKKWQENPSSDLPLQTVSAFITPLMQFSASSLEKYHEKYQASMKRSSEFYSKVIDSYQDSDASERDFSKVIKFDVDVSPNHMPFTIKMKQLYNKEIQDSLLMQRKTRNALKSKTLLSTYNAQKATDSINTKQRTKQSINTLGINTDNIAQKYERRPSGVKTNSRRLNLLETPVAVKQRSSVPYVNEYEQSKLLFS